MSRVNVGSQKLVVDTLASTVAWKGYKPGGSHRGTLGIKQGELSVENGELVSGTFTLDMNKILCEDLTDAKMNEQLVGHLKNADFFDVAKYPEGKFTITTVEKLNDGVNTHRISGNLELKGVSKKERYEKAMEMIKIVGLEGHENKWSSNLSGGQQQRVAIARGLIADSQIIFLDNS
jgi:polyisoprenoid-binding protein YceI